MSLTVLAMLSLLLAPLSILSGAGVALVTLRLGAKEGILLIVSAWFACSALSYLIFADVLAAAAFTLILWVPVWFLSLLLRSSRSLNLTVEAALMIGVVATGYFFLAFADPGQYWVQLLKEPVNEIISNGQVEMSAADAEKLITEVSRWMTAVITTGYFAQLVAVIFVGRWWQAMIYNPGGFGEEFRALRFHRITAYVSAPVIIMVLLGNPADWILAIATLLLAAYFIQGLAVVHNLLKKAEANSGWIVGIYVLLIIAMPYVMAALSMTGYSDAFLNFRKTALKAGNDNDS